MMQTDEPLAVPLWISGHAYLTLAPDFLDVRDAQSGRVLRRTPLCGSGEARQAVAAASAALGGWAAAVAPVRGALLAAVGDALATYTDHFSRLIGEESGLDAATAAGEVAAAVALLRAAPNGAAEGVVARVVAVVGDCRSPLLAVLRVAVPLLAAGATVVVRPAPQAPSALTALAELTGRCDFPEGVFNVVHGAQAVLDALRVSGAELQQA